MTEKARLVFVSGWGAGSGVWQQIEKALWHNYEIRHVSVMDLSEHMQQIDCDGLVHHLSEKIPDASTVIAWSLGGMLAAKVAARYPGKIGKLILFATNISFVESATWPAAMSKHTFNEFKKNYQVAPEKTRKRFIALQALGDQKRKRVVEQLDSASELNSNNISRASSLLQVLGQLNLADDVASLKLPVQFFFGQNDALVPIEAADKLKLFADEVFSGSTFDIVQIENCGHAPHISCAEQCLQYMFSFLQIHDPRYKKDKEKIARSFSRAAKTYNTHAALQKEVAEDLMALAQGIKGTVADLGCGTGYCMDFLKQRGAQVDRILAVDIAENMLSETRASSTFANDQLHCVLADIELLPFKPASLDWVVSSLAIQWCDNLESLFAGVKNAMSDSGSFLFSTLGENTLFELSQSWTDADPNHIHVNQFTTTKQIVDVAETLGFELQHFESKRRVLEYDDVMDLMRDLKGIGAHNVNYGINKGLTGVKALSALSAAYETYRNENNRLPATYDVEYWLLTKRRVI